MKKLYFYALTVLAMQSYANQLPAMSLVVGNQQIPKQQQEQIANEMLKALAQQQSGQTMQMMAPGNIRIIAPSQQNNNNVRMQQPSNRHAIKHLKHKIQAIELQMVNNANQALKNENQLLRAEIQLLLQAVAAQK